MKLLTKEELMSSTGIGASDVPIICHESPFKSAYQLWMEKTGRAPKKPMDAAMMAGIELESQAMEEFREHHLSAAGRKLIWNEQVAAESDVYPFLRSVADGFCTQFKEGVNVKSPQSDKLLDHSGIPRHYLLQYAAEMYCFDAETWWQYIYMPGKPGRLDKVTWGTIFESCGSTLKWFWDNEALPAIESFWTRLDSDTWLDGTGDDVSEKDWLMWNGQFGEARELKEEAESLESEAKANLKRMLGQRKRFESTGYVCRWQPSKASYSVKISCDTEESMAKIVEMLAPLADANGVLEVKTDIRRENYSFYVEHSNDHP